MQTKLLLSSFFLILSGLLYSQGTVVYDDPDRAVKIGNVVEVLEDSIGLAFNKLPETGWVKSELAVPNLGITENTYWLRFKVENRTNEARLFLEIDNPIINLCNLYSFQQGKIRIQEAGEEVEISEREMKHQNPIFTLMIPPGSTEMYMLEVKSGDQVFLPMSLGAPDVIFGRLMIKDLVMGIYVGVILVMFFYNFFIYLTTREKSYLYYVFYILSVGLVQTSLQGYTYQFLWPDNSWFAQHSLYIFNTATAFLAILFMRDFVQVKSYFPKLDKVFNVFIGLYSLMLILALFGPEQVAYNLNNLIAMLLSIYMLVVAVLLVRRGARPAIFFLLAWSIFLVGIILFVLKDQGVIPHNLITAYILPIGSALEVVLLSFGLADKINLLKKEKELSQREALRVSKENERIVREQNILLEAKVEERTAELKGANTVLEKTLEKLKDTQAQLVDQEKMASLGQLTAGIAHEINNPINFVTSNVNPLKRDIGDLIEVLDKYDSIQSGDEFDSEKAGIEALKEEVDIDFVKEEIASLLKGIGEGASRTAEIVRGLKVFSRMDEQDIKRVDIIEGIESTITLLRSSTQGRIEFVRDFNNIPMIECFAGKLNQVFMNLLSNAIHAVLAKEGLEKDGFIKIGVRDDGDFIKIIFEDNGTGMSDDVKQKIFEPFFTTKQVGEGTGLGMSITFSIIEKHRGTLEVESEVGVGSKFIIRLPKEIEGNQGDS